jgi:NADH:ubiquinone oxidoreductase subunit 3 (subunit A)
LATAGLAVVFVVAGLFASRLLAPHRPGGLKDLPYECGEHPIGSAWIRFNVGYYLFALLFLVFDVEAIFLFPWALVLHEAGVAGLIEVAVFVLIAFLVLLYAWRKGALEWD